MAIGDAVQQLMGNAQEDRQPASGVEEQVTSLSIDGATGVFVLHTGVEGAPITAAGALGTAQDSTMRNMAVMITNAMFLRKDTASNTGVMTGVQTNV